MARSLLYRGHAWVMLIEKGGRHAYGSGQIDHEQLGGRHTPKRPAKDGELLADSDYFGTFLDFVIFNLLPLLGGGGICLVLCFLFEFSLLGRFLALGI